jgi:hypothetical protein
MSARISGRDEKLLQVRLQPRTNDVSRVLRLSQQLGRHDHVGVYCPQRHPQFLCGGAAPCFGLAQWIFVPNDQRSFHFVAEARQAVLGKTAKHESDISFRE